MFEKMKFNKVLVVYNEKLTKKYLQTVEKVKNLLNEREVSIAKSHNLNYSLFKDVDLVITIGGDGTFIRAAHFVKDTLILGINSEPNYSEGALTTIMENETEILKKILDGEYKTMLRYRAEIKRNGSILKETALNDVYIGSFSQFHTSRYIIKLKSKEEEQRSSGVLIATASGSSAWYKSAGGKLFGHDEKGLKFIVREPYFGRVFRPTILEGEIAAGEKITFKSKMHQGGVIAIDSNSVYDFNAPDSVEIKISNNPLNVIIKK